MPVKSIQWIDLRAERPERKEGRPGERRSGARPSATRGRDTPILGADGYVQWIINRAEDVTELVELREKAGKVS